MKTVSEVLQIVDDMIEHEGVCVRSGEFIVSVEDLTEFNVDLRNRAMFTISNRYVIDGEELELEGYTSQDDRTFNLFSFHGYNAERIAEVFLNI